MNSTRHAVAVAIVERRNFGLTPDPGESERAFANRALDAVAERMMDLVKGLVTDQAEDLYYALDPHHDAEALRISIGNLVGLVNDATALLDIIPNDEAISQ